jgi:hypothetical protein
MVSPEAGNMRHTRSVFAGARDSWVSLKKNGCCVLFHLRASLSLSILLAFYVFRRIERDYRRRQQSVSLLPFTRFVSRLFRALDPGISSTAARVGIGFHRFCD